MTIKKSFLQLMRYSLLILVIVSCNNEANENHAAVAISTEKLDTIKENRYAPTVEPAIFETSFFSGTQARTDNFDIRFFAVNIGEINIESGKIIACDPILMHQAVPFSQIFPTGKFPVQLAIAKIKLDERVAFSRILFSNKPVASWRYALHNGEKEMSIFDTTFYGYSVDGGVGIFIDSTANFAFNAMSTTDNALPERVFMSEMDKHTRQTWQYAVYNFGNHNLATFSTGLGDGSYGTYIGLDKEGNVCRLLTDFGFVEWWKK
jgi:Protein of unknown function (DUF4241)